MLSKPLMLLRRMTRTLWVRVVLIALLSVIAAAFAPLVALYLPEQQATRLDRDAVMPVLTILASGMLAVTTFSLNVMVGAYRSAAGQSTPRVYRLLLEDTTTQTVLATFIGAFIFALTAILLYQADLYPPGAGITVFVVTVLVVMLIVLAILRWVDHLSLLGSMDHTLNIVTAKARGSLCDFARAPTLGGQLATGDTAPTGSQPIRAPRTGYIQFIDMPGLQSKMGNQDAMAHLTHRPGDYVLDGEPIGFVTGGNDALPQSAARCFRIASHRSLEQDPRYALLLMSETASRALSPGINDPGTAVDVIHRLSGLLWEMAAIPDDAPACTRITLPAITPENLLSHAFAATARDGSDQSEVMAALTHALQKLDDRATLTAAARAFANTLP